MFSEPVEQKEQGDSEAVKFWKREESELKEDIAKTNDIAGTRLELASYWRELQYGKTVKVLDHKKQKLLEFKMERDLCAFLRGIRYLAKLNKEGKNG